MPEKTLTIVTTKELNNLKLGTNKVLIESMGSNEGRTTKSGIVLGHNTLKNYAEGKGSHPADMAEIKGQVYKLPDRLYFKRGDKFSMSWDTPQELVIGDLVWFDYLVSLNCDELAVDDKVFKILPYQDLYVGKRDDYIFPLNGYCLFSSIKKEKISPFDITPDSVYNYSKGRVEYTGIPNKTYDNINISDDIELAVGDMVYFSKHFARYPIFLERFQAFADMDGEMYLRAQRKDVVAVIKNSII